MPKGKPAGPHFRKGVAFGRAHIKHTCDTCHGSGEVLVDASKPKGDTKTCPNCDGEGER